MQALLKSAVHMAKPRHLYGGVLFDVKMGRAKRAGDKLQYLQWSKREHKGALYSVCKLHRNFAAGPRACHGSYGAQSKSPVLNLAAYGYGFAVAGGGRSAFGLFLWAGGSARAGEMPAPVRSRKSGPALAARGAAGLI